MEAPTNTLESGNALCFGMVYSKEHRPNAGQPYRDRVRCAALQIFFQTECRKDYRVLTCDIDHEDHHFEDLRRTSARTGVVVKLENHIFANFNSSRRMFINMKAKWGNDLVLDKIYWDWFFCTVSI